MKELFGLTRFKAAITFTVQRQSVDYGNSNAKNECESYYNRVLNEFISGHIKEAMLYLGAACHSPGCDYTSACQCQTS